MAAPHRPLPPASAAPAFQGIYSQAKALPWASKQALSVSMVPRRDALLNEGELPTALRKIKCASVKIVTI